MVNTTIKIGGELDPSVPSSFDKISQYVNKMQPSFEKFISLGKGAAVGLAASIGLGTASFMDYDDAMRQLQASTGNLTDSSVDLAGVMQSVYGDNFGESWGDVGESIAVVNKLIGGTSDELKSSTEDAIAFRDTFEVDVGESARAASTLMKQFGIDSSQAYNLMAQGEQQGLDYSDELIDSINEYSVQFAKFGFSAEDMFNIFADGAADGAFNLDKVGDAVKEFSIRAIDGSKTTIDGFTQLGMNVDDMANRFGTGGETARDAFVEVVNAIKDVDDPVQQSIIGVDLFGTMWEDLGPEVVTQLGAIGDAFNSNIDTMNEISNIKYTSFSSGLEGIKRQIQTAIIPLGESLVPTMNEFANWFAAEGVPKIQEFSQFISDNLPTAIEVAKGVFEGLSPIFSFLISALPEITSLFAGLGTSFAIFKTIGFVGGIIEKVTPLFTKLSFVFEAVTGGAGTLGEALFAVTTPVGWIVAGIGAAIAIITLLYMKCEPFREFVNNLFSSIASFVTGTLLPQLQGIGAKLSALWTGVIVPFATWIGSVLAPVFTFVFTYIGSIISTFVSAVGSYISSLLTVFGGIIDFVTGVFTGNWDLAWQGVKEIFSGIFEGIYDIAAVPINAIIDLINSAIAGINTLGFDIKSIPAMPTNFNDIGGGDSSGIEDGTMGITDFGDVPQFASGGFATEPSICGEGNTAEAVIPLRRNNPRSLSLLKTTANALGAESSRLSSGIQIVYSPVISGNVNSSTISALENDFNNFKEKVLQVLEEEGRLDYA